MATRINPYLTFGGKCREAMTFYQKCLGGDLTLQTVGESPAAEQCPEGMQHQIIHSMLENDSSILMATDMSRGELTPGNDMAIAIQFDTEDDIRRTFDALSDGGEVLDELREAFWGGLFGVLKDRYGKVWMLECSRQQLIS